MSELAVKLTKKDFETENDVRWCPGCGDYAVLANMQRTLPELGIARENIVFISGIGCSSRFPYYMNTYGFHTIHGRAPTLATGLKMARPELSLWVITGDGDALSIGGNHIIHLLRRNVDLNVLLFNNRIYGLTKGQASPTSEVGKKTKSTPMGTVDAPFNPIMLTLGAGASFVARSVDIEAKHLQEMLKRSEAHRGTSFVEIFQNCPIFNDHAFDSVTDKSTKADNVVVMEHGKPLVFGKDRDKGLRRNGHHLEVVTLGESATEADMLIHDEADLGQAFLLAQLQLPVPVGVFYRAERATADSLVNQQVEVSRTQKGAGDLQKLLNGSSTWTVE
jgi:2-oxoglutarate/2-oxoacid ferredoxin oxidoreductase subunit beta